MNIYFAGAIRAGRDDQEIYHQLIQGLQRHGTVLTEHVGDSALTQWGDDGPSDQIIFQRDMAWLAQAALVVAEVTMPSLGVGYEIGRAESLGIPVLCLYREGKSHASRYDLSNESPSTICGEYLPRVCTQTEHLSPDSAFLVG